MRLVILDRDGVINQEGDAYICSPLEWTPLPGSLEAIARLSQGGYQVVVATNQSGIARGLFTVEDLHAMHKKMDRLLAQLGGRVEGVFFCPHAPRDHCRCRKPRPGLLEQIAHRLGTSLAGVPAIGDAQRDLLAAEAAGARPVLVRTGKGQQTLCSPDDLPASTVVCDDLAAAADAILTGRL